MEERSNNNAEKVNVDIVNVQLHNESTKDKGNTSIQNLSADSAVDAAQTASMDANTDSNNGVREFWVQIKNLPASMRQKNIKAFLMSRLGTKEVNRIRVKREIIFFTLPSQEEAIRAVNVLNGITAKGRMLIVAMADSNFKKPPQLPVIAPGMGSPRRGPLLGAHNPVRPLLRPPYPTGSLMTPRYPDMTPPYRGVKSHYPGISPIGPIRPSRPLLEAGYSRPIPTRPTSDQNPRSEVDKVVVRSGEEPVTPLAHLEYSEQLKCKTNDAIQLINALLRHMAPAGVKNARNMSASDILQPIRYSSRTLACYNKCEFTVGRDPEGMISVGFVGKRSSSAQSFIVPVDTYTHISQHMKRIASTFQKFVAESREEPFNELEHTGVWKSLMIRECSGDVLIMATIFPMKNSEREQQLKKSFAERFLRSDNLSDKDSQFRVTSVYWERIGDAGEDSIRENIGGTPYIYETINGTRFRILPDTCFPTNSYAAAVFLSTIAEKAGIMDRLDDLEKQKADGFSDVNSMKEAEEMLQYPEETKSEQSDIVEDEKMDMGSMECSIEIALSVNDNGPAEEIGTVKKQMEEDEKSVSTKKPKIDTEDLEDKRISTNKDPTSKGTIIVSISCGVGNIGLYLMRLLRNSKYATGRNFLFGNDLLSEVIESAERNALDNAFAKDEFRFVAGRMEDVVPTLQTYLPSWVNVNEANIIGILDPPRGRINDNVAIACRTLSCMRKLIYVSSEPSLALRNLVDLCKPSWKKYGGEPFKLTSVTPVDMFPHTEHCEWVIQLDREECS